MTHTNKMPPFPPDITTHQRPTPFGMVYEFEHERLGSLDRVSSLPQSPGRTQIAIETEGDPDDPQWAERFAQLKAIVRVSLTANGERKRERLRSSIGDSSISSTVWRCGTRARA